MKWRHKIVYKITYILPGCILLMIYLALGNETFEKTK